jgi:hypothetical protein
MSWFENVSPKSASSDSAKPMFDAAAMAQLGALSPLWMLFIGASTAGMAYWGMTRWMRLAVPERIAQNVVTLRLVKSGPALKPEPVVEPKFIKPQPEPAAVDPVETQAASVSVVMPEPMADAAALVAPDLVKVAPKPKTLRVAKPKTLKTAEPKIAALEPNSAKVPAKRGRPPKIKAETPAPTASALNVEPSIAGAKAPGAKRGPKPKIKA